jgi:hypothetical protein
MIASCNYFTFNACAVPGNSLDDSDILKALSKAVADSVGKPEQVIDLAQLALPFLQAPVYHTSILVGAAHTK